MLNSDGLSEGSEAWQQRRARYLPGSGNEGMNPQGVFFREGPAPSMHPNVYPSSSPRTSNPTFYQHHRFTSSHHQPPPPQYGTLHHQGATRHQPPPNVTVETVSIMLFSAVMMNDHNGPHGTFGDRVNMHSDKELSDLLDFSAMFSPPIGSNGGVKNNPQQSNQNMEFGFKPGLDEGSWNSNNPPGSFDRGMYDQNYNGQTTDNMHPFTNEVPNLINNKTTDLPYRTNMPGAQGMMGSNVPMSPDSLSPGAKSPYFYNKQQDMSIKGRRASTHGASGKRSKEPVYVTMSSDNYPRPFPMFFYPRPLRPTAMMYPSSPEEYNDSSNRYHASPNPMFPKDSYYMPDGPGHNTPDPWSSSNGLPTSTYPSMLPGNSHHSQAYPSMHHSHDMVRSSPVGNSDVRHSPGVMVAQWLGNNPPSSSSSSVPSSRHHPQQGYSNVPPPPPPQDNLGLPPMSTFRPGTTIPTTSYSTTSPTVNGGGSGGGGQGSQTGDAINKALASIYSPTDHTNSSYGSNPSTPVSSPPPGSSSQWQRPSTQTSTSPHFEGGNPLHSLPSRLEERLDDAILVLHEHVVTGEQSRMEERLDDAIHVLRHHAGEPQMAGLAAAAVGGGGGGHQNLSMMHSGGNHPNGMSGMSSYSGMGGISSHVDQMGSHHNTSENTESKSLDGAPSEKASLALKEEKMDKIDGDSNKSESSGEGSKSSVTSPGGNGPPSKRSRYGDDTSLAGRSEPNDEDESPETKAERERVRRQANNARERIRVRDINEAFKELGQMVALQSGSTQPLTKVMILQHAVHVISSLEQQVRGQSVGDPSATQKVKVIQELEQLLRVRDINDAFKELGEMVSLQSGSSQPLTKLMILQHAVNVITALEQQVRGRGLVDPNSSVTMEKEKEKSADHQGIRVRDINDAFKELGQMVALHSGTSQPLTKLMILQHAVNVITSLEHQVRERNLNPKAACLKRREEEKTEELPGGRGGMTADDLAAQQAALSGSASLSQMGSCGGGGRGGGVSMNNAPTNRHSAYPYMSGGGQENSPYMMGGEPPAMKYSDSKCSSSKSMESEMAMNGMGLSSSSGGGGLDHCGPGDMGMLARLTSDQGHSTC
uniref:Transcription factor 12 n=1 Tax=Magallana gigas TaxID=29159 RepID=K1QGM5_MAGGI